MGFLQDMKDEFNAGKKSGEDFVDKLTGENKRNAENIDTGETVNTAAAKKEAADEKEYIDGNILPDLKELGGKLGGKLTGFIKKKLS